MNLKKDEYRSFPSFILQLEPVFAFVVVVFMLVYKVKYYKRNQKVFFDKHIQKSPHLIEKWKGMVIG